MFHLWYKSSSKYLLVVLPLVIMLITFEIFMTISKRRKSRYALLMNQKISNSEDILEKFETASHVFFAIWSLYPIVIEK